MDSAIKLTRGYAVAGFDVKMRRVYVRPTDKFEKVITALHKQNQLDSTVTNYMDGVCQVTFHVVDPSVAIQMDSVTGAVPVGHPMFGRQPDLLNAVGHTQKLLTRQVNAGDYGSSSLT